MRRQSSGIRDADSQALERLDFLRQRHRLGDALRLGALLVHRPIDEDSIEATHDHHELLALLMSQNNIVASRETEFYIAGDQRSDVGASAACRGDI